MTNNTIKPMKKERTWKSYSIAAVAFIATGLLIYSGSTVSAATNANDQSFQAATAVNAGRGYSEVITKDGSVYARGLNNYGQLGNGSVVNATEWTKVSLNGKVQKLSGSYNHTAALTTDGKAYTWGENQYGIAGNGSNALLTTPTQVSASYKFSQISSGANFELALTSNGKLFVWGQNSDGQLGTGDTDARTTPTYVPVNATFKSIKAGNNYALALDSNGAIWSWGANTDGQLGTGNTANQLTPTKLNLGTAFANINTNLNSTTSVAVSTNGYLYAWGNNDNGQVGNGTDWRAEQVAENQRVKDEIAAIQAADAQKKQDLINKCVADKTAQWEKDNAAALSDSAGTTDTSGKSKDTSKSTSAASPVTAPSPTATPGPTGTPSPTATPTPTPTPTATPTPTPTPKPTPPDYTADCTTSVNSTFTPTDTSGIKPNIIPEPALKANADAPVLVTTSVKFQNASVGSQNAYAVDVLGRLYGWGSDKNGQSGIGTDDKTHTQVPVIIDTDATFVNSDGGDTWGVALDSNGNVYTWGASTDSQLAAAGTSPVTKPAKVSSNAAAVIAGGHTGYVITKNNTLSSWGAGADNLLATGSAANTATVTDTKAGLAAVSAGSNSSAGLGTDGKLYYWGSNKNQTFSTSDPTTATSAKPATQTISAFKDIAAGRDFTLAVDTTGHVWAWGYNAAGQIGPVASAGTVASPTLVPLVGKAIMVAASENASFAAAGKTVYAWGDGDATPAALTVPATVKQLSAGADNIEVLGTDNHIYNGGGTSAALNTSSDPNKLTEADPNNTYSNVSSAGNATFAVRSDGTVVSWGSTVNTLGGKAKNSITTIPLDMKVNSISAGLNHVLVTTKAGVVWGWGTEPNGTFGSVGTTITAATPIPVLTVKGNN